MPTSDLAALDRRLGGRYRIERELGRGGMGTVYLARETQLDRAVALKVLPSAFADDPTLRDRFLRESRTAASFSHPNIVPVHAVEAHDDLLAFAMGYVEGESLAERVASTGPLTAREALRLMLDVAYALAYAHGRDVVHRDIKPDNLMLERATGRALVMDFGVARRTDAQATAAGLTRVGEVVGTPEYMSPEQATGDVVDGRSDLYSLGLVMWFAVTGRTAMGGDTAPRILVRQLTETLPPIASERSDLPSALAAAIDRCLAKDPAERFADAGALAQALDDLAHAAPEIPLPVRLLANELRMLSVALPLGLVLAATALARSAARGLPGIDALIPWVILIAVLLARLGQTLGDAERLGRRGFTPDDVTTGLRGVVEEADSARAAARLDPDVAADVRGNRRTALVMLVVAIASTTFAWSQRVPVPGGGHFTGPVGVAFLFNGLASLGVSLVLFLRDPRRRPLGERLYRAFWLRAPGQALLRFAMRARAGRTATSPRPSSAATSASPSRRPSATGPATTAGRPATDGVPTTAPLAQLERRVAALEAWRAQHEERRPDAR